MTDREPGGLPPIKSSKTKSALDRSRICPKCEKEGRVISNSTGLSVFCNPCKWSWPISSAALDPVLPMTPARGLERKTLAEPNWDMAYEQDIGAEHGPPDKR
jgi:hypothetical protein